MPTSPRIVLSLVAASIPTLLLGCMDPYYTRQSQLRTQQIYQQARSLAHERDQLATQRAQLAQQQQALEQQLNVANRRVSNLQSANSQMEQRLAGYFNNIGKNNPLPKSATRRFEELAKKYPNFEFDPTTGVSKFHSDLLFDSGSATVKSNAQGLLREFVSIMNDPEAQKLNILVVGHTDDKPIVKSRTRSKHPTNWHLSTNRADSVVMALSKLGLKDSRMGVAGYSKYQPLVPNSNDTNRKKNRRVEIYVLSPDAVIAQWDPGSRFR
jgi:chemotaxis protein MotB